MTSHFTDDVTLTGGVGGLFQIEFKGVRYQPTDDTTAAGVLLFGLRPKGIRFSCAQDPEPFMQGAAAAGYKLHFHANRHKMAEGMSQIPGETLETWIDSAVALAPDTDSQVEARRLILENLGPYAFT
jgi:hypothetical protein